MKKGISLRTKLVAGFLGVNILITGIGYIGMSQLRSNQKSATEDQSVTFAESLDEAIQAQFYERYGDIQAFAMNPILRTGDKATVVDYLNRYAALHGIYDLIMLTDRNGNLIAVNDKAPSGDALKVSELYKQNYATQDWFKKSLKGEFTENKEKAFLGTYVEQPLFDDMVEKAYGKQMYGNSFSAQVKNEKGDVIGVITNRAGIRWMTLEFQNLYKKMKKQGLSSAEFTLLDGTGNILLEYDPTLNGDKEEFVFDKETLGKVNLIEKGIEVAKWVTEGKSGHSHAVHARKGIEQMVGYTALRGPKVVDSLGWGLLVRFSSEQATAAFSSVFLQFLLIQLGACLLVLTFSTWFTGKISKALNAVVYELKEGAAKVTGISRNVLDLSTTISEGATEQAAAIQETASAIDEVSAMVKSNSENATQSKEVSTESREAAAGGQNSVQQVIGAMGEIDQSNADIMKEIEASNKEMGEIVRVIGEIGNKTKVINDIVFQTKLLSFNASVEAARAGEHGKGFAVVAEEVGNLAQMSGNAAKEISYMLDSSIKEVEETVRSSQSKVEKLIAQGKRKVEGGNLTAQECGKALTSILDSVTRLDSMVVSIATASNEQATGVSEINRAISQLDTVTQQNSQVAQKAAGVSTELNTQSTEMSHAVSALLAIVEGRAEDSKNTHVGGSTLTGGNQKKTARQIEVQKKEVAAANVVSLSEAREKSQKHEPKVMTASETKVVGGESIPSPDDARFEEL